MEKYIDKEGDGPRGMKRKAEGVPVVATSAASRTGSAEGNAAVSVEPRKPPR